MNAKEAIFAELGDLFSYNASKVAQDASVEQAEIIEEGEIYEDSESSDAMEGIEGDQPPDLFDMVLEDESTEEDQNDTLLDEKLKLMTDEECDSCIKAINEAISSRQMPPSQLEWGLNLMEKINKVQNERILADLNAIDADAERSRQDDEDAEEEARENAEKEQYLRL